MLALLIFSRTTLVYGLAQHGHGRRGRGEEPNPVLQGVPSAPLQFGRHHCAPLGTRLGKSKHAYIMSNKAHLAFIVLAATVFFVAGCSTPRRGEKVAAQGTLPLATLDQSMNDRSTWIDSDPAKHF
jgi:hypothetical protein